MTWARGQGEHDDPKLGRVVAASFQLPPFPGVAVENAIISDKGRVGARPGGTRCPLDPLSCRLEGASRFLSLFFTVSLVGKFKAEGKERFTSPMEVVL